MLIFAQFFINIKQNLGKGSVIMQTMGKSFSMVAQKIGYGEVAKLADVTYQSVSTMAANPIPGGKYRIRRRILTAVIEEAEKRVERLKTEAAETEQQVIELKAWRATEFDK